MVIPTVMRHGNWSSTLKLKAVFNKQ